jgi:uncharacterized protein
MLFRLLFLCGILLFVEIYAYQAFKTLIKVKWILQVYQVFSLFLIVYIVYSIFQYNPKVGQTQKSLFTMGLLLLSLLPKLVITFVMISEDIFRIGSGCILLNMITIIIFCPLEGDL